MQNTIHRVDGPAAGNPMILSFIEEVFSTTLHQFYRGFGNAVEKWAKKYGDNLTDSHRRSNIPTILNSSRSGRRVGESSSSTLVLETGG